MQTHSQSTVSKPFISKRLVIAFLKTEISKSCSSLFYCFTTSTIMASMHFQKGYLATQLPVEGLSRQDFKNFSC